MKSSDRGDQKVRSILSHYAAGKNSGQHPKDQNGLDHQQGKVDASHAVNHKAGTFGTAVATAAHGIAGNHTSFQSPVGQG